VTNGLTHLYASTNWNTGLTEWLKEIPPFEDS
jgi:hypothetical protein